MFDGDIVSSSVRTAVTSRSYEAYSKWALTLDLERMSIRWLNAHPANPPSYRSTATHGRGPAQLRRPYLLLSSALPHIFISDVELRGENDTGQQGMDTARRCVTMGALLPRNGQA